MRITLANPVHAIIANYANMGKAQVVCPTLDQYSGSADLCRWIRTFDRNAECDPSDCISDLWATIASILMD